MEIALYWLNFKTCKTSNSNVTSVTTKSSQMFNKSIPR